MKEEEEEEELVVVVVVVVEVVVQCSSSYICLVLHVSWRVFYYVGVLFRDVVASIK